jgi:hypothetical protein
MTRIGEQDHPVRQGHRLVDIVRHKQNRLARALPDIDQFRAQAQPRVGVECGERLVHQHDIGLDPERPRDRHTLPLAAGKHARIFVDVILQANKFQQRARLVALLVADPAVAQLHAKQHVVERGAPGRQARRLKHEGHTRPCDRRLLSVDANIAAVLPHQAAKQPKRC